jgi:hypothetical protein
MEQACVRVLTTHSIRRFALATVSLARIRFQNDQPRIQIKIMTIGIDPTVDFARKRVLGSPEHPTITLRFLNAVLRLLRRAAAENVLDVGGRAKVLFIQREFWRIPLRWPLTCRTTRASLAPASTARSLDQEPVAGGNRSRGCRRQDYGLAIANDQDVLSGGAGGAARDTPRAMVAATIGDQRQCQRLEKLDLAHQSVAAGKFS